MLLTVACPICATPGRAPCKPCAARLAPAPALPPPPGTDACLALLAYDGGARQLVARLKYRNQRAALGGLAAAMAALVPGDDASGVVTWVPTTASRRRARGYDQAELLARAVARRLRRRCVRLLVRRPGPAQTGRSGAARRVGPGVRARRACPAAVLVVDDVVTTGATASAAAAALRAAGATRVVVLAAARTPPPGG